MNTDRAKSINNIEWLVEHKYLAKENIEPAKHCLQVNINNQDVYQFFQLGFQWLASIFIGVSFIFFVAANWDELGTLGKFFIIQIPVVLSALAYLYFKNQSIKKSALTIAFLTIGAAFALFGQTYQTGADTWQLFFNWALIAAPFVFISRTTVLYVLWGLVINIAYIEYARLWLDDELALFVNILLNIVLLISWEIISNKCTWVKNHWPTNILSAYLLSLCTYAFAVGLWNQQGIAFISLVLSHGVVAACFYFFRYKNFNFLVLVYLGIVLITCANFLLFRIFENHWNSFFFLLSFLLTISMGFGLAKQLRRIHKNSRTVELANE